MSELVELKYTRIFEEHQKAKLSDLIIHRGGARSSKTYSIAQDTVCGPFISQPDAGFRCLILRKTLPAVKTSVLVSFKDVLDTIGLRDRITEEKKELNYRYGRSLIHFSGLDDVEKIKSSEWHLIWMEEATDFSYDEYSQLQLRLSAPEIKGFTNKLILSFNPIDENHWIKTRLLKEEPDAVEIVSTYRDNPFLPEKYKVRIENLIKKDANFARIYRDGEWGMLENIIYNNWKVVDEFPSHINDVFFGLDFGYNDEMAMIKVGAEENSDTFWEQEVFYEKETTIEQLVPLLPHLMGSHRKKPIYCDSANPDKIKTLRSHGFNAKPCIKGKYSITNGIEFLKTQDIKIIDGSTNLIKEKQSYSWRKDRHGKILDDPIDYLNHLMDAERYAIITHIKRGGGNVKWLDLLG